MVRFKSLLIAALASLALLTVTAPSASARTTQEIEDSVVDLIEARISELQILSASATGSAKIQYQVRIIQLSFLKARLESPLPPLPVNILLGLEAYFIKVISPSLLPPGYGASTPT